ncbi:putative formylmethanofuran dehydrogenase, subunit E [Desulfamplus magnetovallimortis]|uniref:Putative formylmethanofuran dehydrogenase, subunit E n=1 Tax=Desulfamplus magnetovallimortis TaxID=1246637 RepID=A0A1W1H9G4_9BACT|nr:FmdE family protein [Desulfamplus magnetovallimortis]SLM29111.1 putative formylmethanofuran dehydrogenase, subunit E [Desulfamplus magnetovallimortis]
MSCTINQELIDKTIEFHGHTCPGLAIGIRLSELAMTRLDIHNASAKVCVAETDMCALDAVQFLTGCSIGKGNLIHRDYGKSGFTFFNRDTGKGFRALFREDFRSSDPHKEEVTSLMKKISSNQATEEEKRACEAHRKDAIKRVMNAKLESLFTVSEISEPPVRPAKILQSIECEECREMTMESRIRRFDGRYLCIPCFIKHEQKI